MMEPEIITIKMNASEAIQHINELRIALQNIHGISEMLINNEDSAFIKALGEID